MLYSEYTARIKECESEISEPEHYRQLRLEDADELTKDISDIKARITKLIESRNIAKAVTRRKNAKKRKGKQ